MGEDSGITPTDIPMVSMSLRDYQDMSEAARKYHALMHAGVDNWDGYSEAMKEFESVLD